MKKLHILFFVLLMATSIFAVDGHDEGAIEKRLQQNFEAYEKQDWETISSLCTNDWMMVLHNGARMTMDDMKQFFTAHITEHSIALSNIKVHVSGDATMAWATFDEETSYKFDGNPVSEKAVFTAIFEKEGEDWKIKTQQRTLVQPPPEMTEKK